MDKKMICGVLFTLIGLVFSAVVLNYVLWNLPAPEASAGFLDSFVGAALALSLLMMIMGLSGCILLSIKDDH